MLIIGAPIEHSTPALSLVSRVLKFARMAYLTLAAEINHGRITVAEPDKLPATGKALSNVVLSNNL